jgi:hypothetical protein
MKERSVFRRGKPASPERFGLRISDHPLGQVIRTVEGKRSPLSGRLFFYTASKKDDPRVENTGKK